MQTHQPVLVGGTPALGAGAYEKKDGIQPSFTAIVYKVLLT